MDQDQRIAELKTKIAEIEQRSDANFEEKREKLYLDAEKFFRERAKTIAAERGLTLAVAFDKAIEENPRQAAFYLAERRRHR